jgi:hypothetical protein
LRTLLHLSSAAVVCVLGITTAALASPATLVAYSERALPLSIGKYAKDLTWSGRDAFLIATELGIYSVPASGGPPTEVIKRTPLPEGLPDPNALSSDGQSVSAISWDSNGGFVLRLAGRKRLEAQRSIKLIPIDVALSGSHSCVIGFATNPLSEELKDVAAWCGGISDSWPELKPLHFLHNDHARDLFRSAPGSFGGRVAIESDGTVDVITSVQPGVFRYGADGKLKEILGQSIDDLVIESMNEIRGRFASDLENRYRLLLNTQPLIEDLVITPSGPAIVVRLAEGNRIHWELWYPVRSGGIGERIRLGIDRIGPYGHLRCDTFGSDLACAGSQPPRNEASIAKTAQAWPHLWLFHLSAKTLSARR